MALTPSQTRAEAQALYDVLYEAFSRSPVHKGVMERNRATIVMALQRKLETGWVPKKGFRTITSARAPSVPELSREEGFRLLAHAFEVFREAKASGRAA